jgi:hypothetical protein
VRGGAEAAVRSVELSLAPARQGARGKAARAVQLQDADPGIPLDQVPFFTRDLARLGIIAAIMVGVMLGGAQLIPLVIK